jgi:hypothetical protein
MARWWFDVRAEGRPVGYLSWGDAELDDAGDALHLEGIEDDEARALLERIAHEADDGDVHRGRRLWFSRFRIRCGGHGFVLIESADRETS